MARFLADENFPLPVVLELRRLGHDILTMHEAALTNQQVADDAVLAYATVPRPSGTYLESQAFCSPPQSWNPARRHHCLHVRPRLREASQSR
jgi:hypothetical protein